MSVPFAQANRKSNGGLDALPFEHLLAWLDLLRQAFEESDSPEYSKQYLKT